jgi:hypothetical protein
VRLVVATLLVLAVAGCAGAGPSGVPSTSPVSPSPPVPPVPSMAATGSIVVPIDPTLLGHLPDDVGGLPLVRSDEGVTEAASDPLVREGIRGIAGALYVDPAQGDFAFVAVMRVRIGSMSDDFYRDWRDSFDEGACSQADGLDVQTEATIGGRAVFAGRCSGGLATFHTWLAGPGVLVSISSVGEQVLGQLVVQGLRD